MKAAYSMLRIEKPKKRGVSEIEKATKGAQAYGLDTIPLEYLLQPGFSQKAIVLMMKSIALVRFWKKKTNNTPVAFGGLDVLANTAWVMDTGGYVLKSEWEAMDVLKGDFQNVEMNGPSPAFIRKAISYVESQGK